MEGSKKVLVVEDELIISLMIEKMIQEMGHDVVAKATSGEEAIEAADQYKPDIILMDIRLKGNMTGIEAMERIRERREVPVIYVTGNSDEMYKGKINDSNPVTFLTKPVTFHELDRSFNFAS